MIKKEAEFLFEVSWEVCNKVGGIYTVVRSKIGPTIDYYQDNFYVIGPYVVEKATGEFQEMVPPDILKQIFDKLKKEGIICYYGVWLVSGEPHTILVDYRGYNDNIDNIKKELWENYGVDSLGTEFHDFGEPVVWGYAVGKLLEEISKITDPNKKIVAQFHEWLSGSALLYLKSRNVKIGTVFTTHATMLGRTIAGNNLDLYGMINRINPKEKAYELGVQSKFLMEKVCAEKADVFTTVSEITGIEAEALLGKKPDVLLPNGLDIAKFPTFEEASIKHHLYRHKIKNFLMYYFFPYYTFDLDNTLIYFIAGRYEYHDKGVDTFTQALAKLNEKLKAENSEKTIIAFFWIPGNIRGIKPELIENQTFFNDVHDSIEDTKERIEARMLYGLLSEQEINAKFLLGENLVQKNKKKVMKFKKQGTPPVCTHDLYDEDKDLVLNGFKQAGLLNKKEDRVKVVFYPIYLTGADRLLDTGYYESMQGSHLGVFASYYEPWGYTPLEAGALGVASVTTDLAGFGRYIRGKTRVTRYPGIYVLDRFGKSNDNDVVDQLTQIMYDYTKFTKQERIENKIQAMKLAALADWKILIENYIRAHNLAVEKVWN